LCRKREIRADSSDKDGFHTGLEVFVDHPTPVDLQAVWLFDLSGSVRISRAGSRHGLSATLKYAKYQTGLK
jgi:hypothetical protein